MTTQPAARTGADYLNRTVRSMPPSGIRRFFDMLAEMTDVISLTIGEPDFTTPEPITRAAIESLERGETHYTANGGMIELRELIARTDAAERVAFFRDVLEPFARSIRGGVTFVRMVDGENRPVEQQPAGVSPTGATGFIHQAVESISEADRTLTGLQDSMLPVEVGDAALRSGLVEVRDRYGDFPSGRATCCARWVAERRCWRQASVAATSTARARAPWVSVSTGAWAAGDAGRPGARSSPWPWSSRPWRPGAPSGSAPSRRPPPPCRRPRRRTRGTRIRPG